MRLENNTLRFTHANRFTHSPVDYWEQMNGVGFDNQYMEKGRAIHWAIARQFGVKEPRDFLKPYKRECAEAIAKITAVLPETKVEAVERRLHIPLMKINDETFYYASKTDVLLKLSNGLNIWDWKSGRSKSVSTLRQLEWYWFGTEEALGVEVVKASAHYIFQPGSYFVDNEIGNVPWDVIELPYLGTDKKAEIYQTMMDLVNTIYHTPDPYPQISRSQEIAGKCIPVAGVSFREGYPESLAELTVGEGVFFEAEPTNKVDPNAIKVLDSVGKMLGYLPASVARSWQGVIEGYVLRIPAQGTDKPGIRLWVDDPQLKSVTEGGEE